MEYLQNYLGLHWTYMDATYADAEIIGTIMDNVRKIREEAMKARLELQRIRDEKAREKQDVEDDFALIVYPDDLEPAYSMVNLELVCTTKDFSLVPYSTTLPYHKYLTAARVAVWHSHLRVLRLIAEEEDIILEDDIDIEKDIRRRLHRIWINLPDDWDIVFLGHCWSNESFWPAIYLPTESSENQYTSTKGVSENTLHPSYSPKCTHAYALSPPGVHKLLAHLEYPPFAYSRAIDQAYAWLVSSDRINAYSVVGSVVVQVKGTVTNSNNSNGTGALPMVSTSSWTEELINGVFAGPK
ncbi:hypothetical protein EV368DRAFT_74047 [Lentinula lateritia]|nr:hypothetical protein EV368DRAFT_74047 [Lentinula lateritia]